LHALYRAIRKRKPQSRDVLGLRIDVEPEG
jgi:hypothetical protein